jgi:hypothetical protein
LAERGVTVAVILNGVDQGINCGLSSAILTGAGSVFIYYEILPSRSTDETYVGLGMRSDSTRAVEIVGIASGELYQVISQSGGLLSSQAIAADTKDGAVHRQFVAWSQESGRRFCYSDGLFESNSSFTVTTVDNPASGLTTLGYRPWTGDNRWFQGQLANVAIWTGAHFGDATAETNAAIALTAGTATVKDFSDFDAYWPLDYDARDLGPNGLDGTLVGTPTFTETAPRWYKGDGTAMRPYLKTSGGIVPLE